MKKSLVLAMAMALGVTASAYAANPFSDVPAGHWAYDSISKLAAAGVVEGYPDGSFKGDNLMTRYEMAQIVAKAMAKGANVDALAAEFADELDNLGVRVAALEKKADNVKITGNIRGRYVKYNQDKPSVSDLRTRISLVGQINEDWTYNGMMEQIHDLGHSYTSEEASMKWQRAWIDGKLGGLKVRAGRWQLVDGTMANANSDGIFQNRVDGVMVTYGKDIQLQGGYAKGSNALAPAAGQSKDFWFARATAQLGKGAAVTAGYFNVRESSAQVVEGDPKIDNKIWTIGAKANLSKKVAIAADYMAGSPDIAGDVKSSDKHGWQAQVKYGAVSAAKPGSFDVFAKYLNQGKYSYIANPIDPLHDSLNGFKGWMFGADYAVAKNIVATVMWADFDDKADAAKDKDQTLWSQIVFTF